MINWKLRLKNKTTLLAILGVIVSAVYTVAGMLGVVPPIGEDTTTQIVALLVNALVFLGVIVDPTTSGVSDSAQAMTYDVPKEDN